MKYSLAGLAPISFLMDLFASFRKTLNFLLIKAQDYIAGLAVTATAATLVTSTPHNERFSEKLEPQLLRRPASTHSFISKNQSVATSKPDEPRAQVSPSPTKETSEGLFRPPQREDLEAARNSHNSFSPREFENHSLAQETNVTPSRPISQRPPPGGILGEGAEALKPSGSSDGLWYSALNPVLSPSNSQRSSRVLRPGAPEINAPVATNDRLISIHVLSCSTGAEIYFAEDPESPSKTQSGWSKCSQSDFPYILSEGEGEKHIYAFVKSGTGLISDAASFVIVLDQTRPEPPRLSLRSPNPTNSRVVEIGIQDCEARGQISFSETIGPLSAESSVWKNCSDSMNYELLSGDGDVEIFSSVRDVAGNISESSSIHLSFDGTPPDLSLLSLSGGQKISGLQAQTPAVNQQNIRWTASDHSGLSNQSISIYYSTDSGLSFPNVIAQDIPNSGAYLWTVPELNIHTLRLRIQACDLLGNCSQRNSSSDIWIDSNPPQIHAFSLAGGAPAVALPYISVDLNLTDDIGELQFKLSEDPVLTDSDWRPYSPNANFNLSMLVGSKQVHLWAKDSAGNISTQTKSIGLEMGNLPIVSLSSPLVTSNYGSADSVPIAWTCSNTQGLDPYPVRLRYTTDDGTTFTDISTGWIANNLTSSTGNFSWIPGQSLPPFRILVECKSSAGVVVSAYSNIMNASWTIWAGDPSFKTENVSILTANLSQPAGDSGRRITATSNGNLYYVRDNAVMKVDSRTSLSTRYFGDFTGTGCTWATGDDVRVAGRYITSPRLLGVAENGTSLYVLACNWIYRVGTVAPNEGIVEWSKSVSGYGARYLSLNKWVFMTNGIGQVFRMDLKNSSSGPEHIFGDGNCVVSQLYNVGDVATSVPFRRSQYNSACYSGDGLLVANADATSFWISPYYTSGPAGQGGWRVDLMEGTWKIGVASTADMGGYRIGCTAYGNASAVCGRDTTGRTFHRFNFATDSFDTAAGTVPDPANDSSGIVHLTDSPFGLIVLYSLGSLYQASLNGSSWTYQKLGGENLALSGNDGPIAQAGLLVPNDIKYHSLSKILVVRNQTHFRMIDFSTPVRTVKSTLPSSGVSPAIALHPIQNKLARWTSCARVVFSATGFTATSLVALTPSSFLGGSCSVVGPSYPQNSGAAANSGVVVTVSQITSMSTTPMTYHSNGKLYFSAHNGTNDVLILSSDMSIINQIAGRTGAGGYSSADHGTSALGASLKQILALKEITWGNSHVGDLLVWDDTKLRLITIATEQTPKIYDLFDFANVPGFSAIFSNISDVIYDSSTEVGGVLGTGRTYVARVNSTSPVHRITPSADLSTGSLYTYAFTGTTFTKAPKIEITPDGLLVVQEEKNRILRLSQ